MQRIDVQASKPKTTTSPSPDRNQKVAMKQVNKVFFIFYNTTKSQTWLCVSRQQYKTRICGWDSFFLFVKKMYNQLRQL